MLLNADSANGEPVKVIWELERDSFQYQVATALGLTYAFFVDDFPVKAVTAKVVLK